MKILVTGSAGFIGSHLCLQLQKNRKNLVIGLDNFDSYYSVKLKRDRIENILKNNKFKNFKNFKINIANYNNLKKIFAKIKPDYVVNLAAQAGVRYSLEFPEKYLKNNIEGFFNILQLSKENKVKHLVFASTSSVYGLNEKFTFKENHTADHPIQFYAATKRSNELMAHSYSHLYKLPCTGLRFFTVYGPWSRPDMSLYKFVDNIKKNKSIEVFNYGDHIRDFTYVDDIVDGIIRAIHKIPKSKYKLKNPTPDTSSSPFEIFNIGNDNPVKLMEYVKIIEKNLNKKAKIKFLPLQAGDIKSTRASMTKIKNKLGYKPKTNIEKGIKNFVEWYLQYKK